MGNLTPYSHSKIALFYQCPFKFKLNYIDKIRKESKNVALFKGSFAHLILENKFNYNVEFETNDIFTQDEKDKVKKYLKDFENSEIGQKYKNIMNSQNCGYEINFMICRDKNSLFACDDKSKSLILGYIDFMYLDENKILNIIDWKTGKFKELKFQGTEQVEIYAIWAFLKFDFLQEVKCKFVYIEHKKETEINYKKFQLKDLISKHIKRIKKIEISNKLNEFKKTISPLCNWCDYYKDECSGEEEFKIQTIKF